MSLSNQGMLTRCSVRVTRRSSQRLRFRLTNANSAAKTVSATTTKAIAPRPRASARRGGNTCRTVSRPVSVSVSSRGVPRLGPAGCEVVNALRARVQQTPSIGWSWWAAYRTRRI